MPVNTKASPADPKRWLQEHLANREYSPRAKECLARNIDLQAAESHNRSMQTFWSGLEEA